MNTSLRLKLALLLVFLPLLPAYPLWTDVIYVDANATGANNGSTWADAYKYLQDALTAAGSGTEIRVAQGTYRPDEDTTHPSGTNDRNATFQLKNGVAIYGGFPADGGSRDPNIYKAILSGDINVPDNNSDNSYHVVTASNTNETVVLDGFTVTGGYADVAGGGMLIGGGSPTLTNCTFIGNSAYGIDARGGGVCSEYSSPTITNCTFSGNLAYGDIYIEHAAYGGGLYMYNDWDDRPTITNCTFNGNSASGGDGGSGGGMYSTGGSTIVTNCTFTGNSADVNGGGIFIGGYATITNSTFNENSAGFGGGVYNSYEDTTITNCTFSKNTAYGGYYYETCVAAGGGVCNRSLATITNCTFIGNSACCLVDIGYGQGGGMSNNGYAAITNCTFSGNSASSAYYGYYGSLGGGVCSEGFGVRVTNCTLSRNIAGSGGGILGLGPIEIIIDCSILYGNMASYGNEYGNEMALIYVFEADVDYSDVKGGKDAVYVDPDWVELNWGLGNIDADPLLIDADGPDDIIGTEDDNLRLFPDSPCIDTANNVAIPIGIETDLDGRDRLADGDCNTTIIVDMGAFEFTYAYFGDFDSDCDVDFLDFAIQASFWLTGELLADIAPTPAGDGIVDASDLAVLCDNWLEGF
jgi:hypothetical protein